MMIRRRSRHAYVRSYLCVRRALVCYTRVRFRFVSRSVSARTRVRRLYILQLKNQTRQSSSSRGRLGRRVVGVTRLSLGDDDARGSRASRRPRAFRQSRPRVWPSSSEEPPLPPPLRAPRLLRGALLRQTHLARLVFPLELVVVTRRAERRRGEPAPGDDRRGEQSAGERLERHVRRAAAQGLRGHSRRVPRVPRCDHR